MAFPYYVNPEQMTQDKAEFAHDIVRCITCQIQCNEYGIVFNPDLRTKHLKIIRQVFIDKSLGFIRAQLCLGKC